MGKSLFLTLALLTFPQVQRVSPGEQEWRAEHARGLGLLEKGDNAEAARAFARALAAAEPFGPDDDRFGESLGGLAEAYRREENHAGLATVSRRILSIRWGAPSNRGDVAVAALVDRFADVLLLAYFPGPEYQSAVRAYRAALDRTPVGEALYLAMSALLVNAELREEAEAVMQRALRAFPDSRRARYREAEMHRDLGRMQKALETFQIAAGMPAPSGMPDDRARAQLSFIFHRIGGINTDLARLDDAVTAYLRALEIDPANADARLALGGVYLRRGQHAEALGEYTRLTTAYADRAEPHYRAAEAYLQAGDFERAATSAGRALGLDPGHRKARYVQGIALTRQGRGTEGQAALATYQKLEAEAQAAANERRNVLVANRGAASELLAGRAEQAVATFRREIAAHPEAPALRFNLAVALSTVGRSRESATVIQDLIDGGATRDFLAYRLAAVQYDKLKDVTRGDRNAALYAAEVDRTLEEALR